MIRDFLRYLLDLAAVVACGYSACWLYQSSTPFTIWGIVRTAGTITCMVLICLLLRDMLRLAWRVQKAKAARFEESHRTITLNLVARAESTGNQIQNHDE